MVGALDIAVCCRWDGIVTEVLRKPRSLEDRLLVGVSLASIAGASSRPKVFSLLRQLVDYGAALDWEVEIAFENGVLPLFFSGCNTSSGVLIIGSAKSRSVAELNEELVRMTGDKTGGIQTTLAKSLADENGETTFSTFGTDQLAQLHNELLRTQLELVEKNLALEEQKAEKFRDLGMAVHGLRNPASSILAATEYLIDDAREGLKDEQMTLLRGIMESSLFILEMIDEVLQISTIECGRLKVDLAPTDLILLINRALLVNQHHADRKEIRFDAGLESSTLIVDLDPVKITQVIDNLLSNAIKFSHSGGKIEIRLTATENMVSVSVRDEGLGIPSDQLGTIFDSFQSSGNGKQFSRAGTGFGLAISRRIIEGHGGTIQVKSQSGKGSTFTVNLPMRSGALCTPPVKAVMSERRLAMGA
ncbi:MAG: HAMP domain-containing histidine kinase [Acidobacteriaceae bacterium]|nr:HAMP domain-containing histidine kinase [Acidobacteriaceae bacterium]